MKIVPCPQCQKSVEWGSSNLFRPFCSHRCRLIDLGAWADESYTIPVTGLPDPLDLISPEEA